VLGGSSAFTPAFASVLADRARDLPPLEVRLHGRDEKKLACVARFCNRHVRRRSVPHEYSYTTSIKDAACDAVIVINQMRIGGWAGRTHDELFPLSFGLPGDETIGPGGLASAIRGLPIVLDAARQAAEASSGAWFINMTNPMGILLAGLKTVSGIRPFGLCELPAITLEKALSLLDCRLEGVEADYLGLNHQGWFVRLAREGRDLLPLLFEKIERYPEKAGFFKIDPAVMRKLGALPLYYMRLYYNTEGEAKKLEAKRASRGEELDHLSRKLIEHYMRADEPDLPGLLSNRSLLWFEMALVPAVCALLGGGEQCLYVTEMNGGDIPGLPPESIVEKRCILDPSGTRMIPFKGPGPIHDGKLEPFLSFLRKVVCFEEAALAAAMEPTADRVIDALSVHPQGISLDKCRAMVPDVLKTMEGAAARSDEGSTG